MVKYFWDRPDKRMNAGQLAGEVKTATGLDSIIRIDPTYVKIDFERELEALELSAVLSAIENHVVEAPGPEPIETLLASLESYGVHSFTPEQVDAFIDGVSTVAELRELLKTMAKCIIAYAEYFEAGG